MDNTRLLVATLLSAIVLVLWGVYFQPQPPTEPPPAETSETTSGEEGATRADDDVPASTGARDGAEEEDGETRTATTGSVESESPVPAEIVPTLDFGAERVVGESQQIVRVDTPRALVELDNRGGVLRTYRLKSQINAIGEPFDLVRPRGDDLYPFAILSGESGSKLNNVLWEVERSRDENGLPQVTFRHLSEAGAAEKIFRWDESGFMRVEVRVDRLADWGLLLGPGIGGDKGNAYAQTVSRAVGYLQGDEAELIDAKDLDEARYLSAREIGWISLEDNYFLVAAVPLAGVVEAQVLPLLEREEVTEGRPRYLPVDTSSSEGDLTKEQAIVLQAGGPAVEVDTYFGAKRYSYLKTLPYELQESVRWGFFGLLSKPLYVLLRWLHDSVVPNYGWAIVIVTLILKLGLFPLTHKSYTSMAKMQELNPKVKAIRARYRPKMKDKQGKPNMEAQRKMNEEVMAVYKSAGVNPASGCFPMLLQIPVFFAFYRLLTVAVELRGAEWILWIDDLSVPDPWYLLPLLMGATSLMMQRMTPSSPDPMQKRLMQMMPIMFTVFAFTFPSGLVLYWMTNNCLQAVQQKIINTSKDKDGDAGSSKKKK